MSMDASPRRPDFLVIGAQRSGTTWLYHVLRQHPHLWLPPVKELHYFDRPQLRRGSVRLEDWLPMAWTGLKTCDLWIFRYFFGLRSDEWYMQLFQKAQAKGLITGEITPAYAILGDNVFHRIQKMNPDVKLIFVMRNPVDRAWSSAHRKAKFGRIDGPLTEEKALESARSHGTALRSSYMDTIRRLERIFPARQLHFCFFDDLRERPAVFVTQILVFLGVDPSKVAGMRLPPAMNSAATGKPIPIEFERNMAREYLPVVQELCSQFGGPPHAWRTSYKKLLAAWTCKGGSS